jgi:hypothetical protein
VPQGLPKEGPISIHDEIPAGGLSAAVRSGDWLTLSRVRGYSVLVVMISVLLCGWWLYSDEGFSGDGNLPFGSDFVAGYAASQMALEGRPQEIYDRPLHLAEVRSILPERHDPFSYPPTALLIVLGTALMPYGVALALAMALTLGAYLAAMYLSLPGRATWIVALGFTAVLINMVHGQNGFLTAALLGAALVAVDRRRFYLAGIPIALMLYKPQFGVLVPFALLAGWHWRTIGATVAFGAIFVGLTVLLFGVETWTAFLDASAFTGGSILTEGMAGWATLQSPFSAARFVGGPAPLAYGVQAVVTLAAIALVAWCWRSPCAFALKAAVLGGATLLATPYVLDYDLMLLAIPLVWLVRDGLERGFLPWEKTFYAFLWMWPVAARAVADASGVQWTPFIIALLLGMILRRKRHFETEQYAARSV